MFVFICNNYRSISVYLQSSKYPGFLGPWNMFPKYVFGWYIATDRLYTQVNVSLHTLGHKSKKPNNGRTRIVSTYWAQESNKRKPRESVVAGTTSWTTIPIFYRSLLDHIATVHSVKCGWANGVDDRNTFFPDAYINIVTDYLPYA